MSPKEVNRDKSGEIVSSAMEKTREIVTSAAANVGGASPDSVDVDAHASSKDTSAPSDTSGIMTKQEAERLYDSSIEHEYAKREGGA